MTLHLADGRKTTIDFRGNLTTFLKVAGLLDPMLIVLRLVIGRAAFAEVTSLATDWPG